jgi:WD40 repeat protein
MNSRAVLALLLLVVPTFVSSADPLPEGAVARFGSAHLLHGLVNHVEFAPDGKSLATSGDDGARLWEVATGQEILLAHLPRSGEVVLTFTPDGSHVVADRKECRVIDPATGKVRCFWRNPGKRPRMVVVAADGKSAVTAWTEGGVTVHDLTGGGKREGRSLSDDDPKSLALSGDGGLLAYATDKAVLLWDVHQRKLLHTYPGATPDYALYPIGLSRDGHRLAISSIDKLRLWDTASHEEVNGFVAPQGGAMRLLFSPDRAELVGLPWGTRKLVRWSATTGKELARSGPPERKDNRYWCPTLSPDGRTGAAVGDSVITLWDVASAKELVPIERWPAWHNAAFVKPGVVATWTRGRTPEEVIAFWNVTDGKLLRKHTIVVPESEWWRRELSPDGKLFAAENEKKGVLVFDVESGKQVMQIKTRRRKDEQSKFAFSPDSKSIVTSDDPKGLMVWDVATGKPLRELEGVSDGVMAFSPDGRVVASAFVGKLVLTEVASGKARHRLELPRVENARDSEDVVERILFSRDGRSVAAISGGYVTVFSTDRGGSILRLDPSGGSHDWVAGALSPDSRWLVQDGRHNSVAVRDLHSRSAAYEFQTLSGHAGEVTGLAFSPDGKYLVSCSADGTALVWDARRLTGKSVPAERDDANLDAEEVAVRWGVLADADPGKAARAMSALVESPNTAVPLLKARLKPAEVPPPEKVERLIADLDSGEFPVRDRAMKELRRIGEPAAPALRKAQEGKPSPEVARATQQLLTELDGPVTDPEQLRQVRAAEVLERIGTKAAREVLEGLAQGAPDAKLTKEARASLDRMR